MRGPSEALGTPALRPAQAAEPSAHLGAAFTRRDGFGHARAALADHVRNTGALDGALGIADGHDLRVITSLRLQIARRTICGFSCPAVASALASDDVVWLEPSAPEGLYLPPHTQVLFVPFEAPEGRAAALLAYDRRPSFSYADRHFLKRSFASRAASAPPKPLPLAA